ncbi:hypothetical protein Noc_1961 [Nitrosococcus oceani ATCC 19707]|uniref:BioF2-like acetyltransferase domain-containing protein n=2 Tax=Nitrosococcus oceani TaxID=1229 RepID=Q3J9S3_NITOC|nr:GNAT family N-acetyltransferase [Nitrosococcus oceani]ABA58423.1 hypothetical protein Noc_1961 [Nitrosococcus oceani ATCC 19707]EDZ67116.1 hypothetical protein NOC27_443 [Nitrosococcus oceani AFC27]KFI19137.1 acetyltransferase [Nitrosococcus oceani C-27]GEM18817.1 acetyltransferase [Nitrosococcus oceani]
MQRFSWISPPSGSGAEEFGFWRVVPARELITTYRTHWQQLNSHHYKNHPLLDIRFVGLLLEYFGADDVFLVVYQEGESVTGLLLLRSERNGMWNTFLPSQAPIGPALLGGSAGYSALRKLFPALPGYAWGLGLACQDSDYAIQMRPMDYKHMLTIPHWNTIQIKLEGSFDAFWNQRSKNLKKNIYRYLRRVKKVGLIPRLEVIRNLDSMGEAVDQYGELESKGWKGRLGTALHRNNVQGQFYRQVMEAFAQEGNAAAWNLYLGDKLAASRLTITGGDMTVILKTAFDEALSRYAPGRLLLYLFLERIFQEEKGSTLEFYTNATQDQLAWCTGSRSIYHINYYRYPLYRWGVATTKRVGALWQG